LAESRRRRVDQGRLTGTSHTEVSRFWRTVDETFLPALEKGDTQAAQTAYATMTAAYVVHRAEIEKIVANVNRMNQAIRKRCGERDQRFAIITWSCSASSC